MTFAQVKARCPHLQVGGQGQGRTADLPLFSLTITHGTIIVGTPVIAHQSCRQFPDQYS